MIERRLFRDCMVGSTFFQRYGRQIHYDKETFVAGDAEIQAVTARMHLVFAEFCCVAM